MVYQYMYTSIKKNSNTTNHFLSHCYHCHLSRSVISIRLSAFPPGRVWICATSRENPGLSNDTAMMLVFQVVKMMY